MESFLFVIVCVLAAWIARTASRTSKAESLVAKLTSLVYDLEEELKQLRKKAAVEIVTARAASPTPPVVAPQPVTPPPQPTLAPVTEAPRAPASEAPPSAPPVPAFGTSAGFSFAKLLNLEQSLGANWLNRLGIIILVIGVVVELQPNLPDALEILAEAQLASPDFAGAAEPCAKLSNLYRSPWANLMPGHERALSS